MAIIVSDSFDRANDPTSLGTADTGQVWSQVSGPAGAFGINSNEALWTWNTPEVHGVAVVDSGFEDAVAKVTLVNPTESSQNSGIGMGLIFRRVDALYFWRLVYYKFPGPANRLRLQRTYNGSTATIMQVNVTLADNDTISVAYCGTDFEIFINDVSQGTFDDSPYPHNYGTQCGIIASPGSAFATLTKRFDDFLVETNGTCTPTYNCTGGACVDPGDGTGTYPTLEACLTACVATPSWDCVDGSCVDPGDGSGAFATLLECELSGCAARVAETKRFDAGTGSSYYVVAQVSDSGDELRSKTIKSLRTTGIRTNVSGMVYGYDVNQEISVDDLETGTRTNTRMTTRPQDFSDSEGVTQSERKPINVANAVLSTVRIEGDDTGNEQRDRIDEIVIEQAKMGVRR